MTEMYAVAELQFLF